MNWLWSFVWGWLPWWAWLAMGIVAAIIVFRLLGWKGVLAVAVTTFGAVAYSRGAKRGIEVERAKQDQADDKARDIIAEKRDDVRNDSDAELDGRFDRWHRKS